MRNAVFMRLIMVILALWGSYVSAASLNKQERIYLDQKEEIFICVDPDWLPFEAIEEGEHVGIAADYFAEFARLLDTQFTLVPTNNWSESLGKTKSGQCDLLTLLNMTDERETYLNFTDPYLVAPIVLVAQEDVYYIDGLLSLAGKQLAVPKNYYYVDILRRDYPEIGLVLTENQKESIKLVSAGEVDAAIGIQVIMLRDLQELSVSNVKVASFTDYRSVLRVGVVKDNLILRDIMAKAVISVNQDTKHEILRRWYSVKVDQGVDASIIWAVVGTGAVLFLILFLQMRSQRKYNRLLTEKNIELERISETDHLTGAFNRLKTDKMIQTEVIRAERYGSAFSVILLDIDHFKVINDTYGHQVGDNVLISLCHLIQRNIRETDVLGRWGGEEFMLVTPELDSHNAGYLAEKIRRLVQEHNFYAQISVTISMGVAEYHHGDRPDKLLSVADTALYRAKRAGRNRIVLA